MLAAVIGGIGQALFGLTARSVHLCQLGATGCGMGSEFRRGNGFDVKQRLGLLFPTQRLPIGVGATVDLLETLLQIGETGGRALVVIAATAKGSAALVSLLFAPRPLLRRQARIPLCQLELSPPARNLCGSL
jgi:hypothetical protein